MADILIKNMEMPKKCFKCPFRDELFCLASDDREINPYRGCQTREKYCPLIELPPHGDLISRSLALSACYEMARFKEMDGAFEVIENAPTVIPASEGE